MTVVTRFAPSPTGYLHIGGARTALFNWLFARHHGGRFLLRIEDTDRARSTEDAVRAIFDGLAWLGLDWDGEAVFQFARMTRHAEVAHALLAAGGAYHSYATPEEVAEMRAAALAEGRSLAGLFRDTARPRAQIAPAVRFTAPLAGETVIDDAVQGRVTLDNRQLDDMVLLRADGTPTYMLSVVVDDHDTAISHVIRGDDHLTNAFRQTRLYRALGWQPPAFAHIPLIHGADGAKLSKRHGALGVEAYRDLGFLPEAMRNYLLRLGWAHGDDEVISTEQAIAWFDLDGIGRSPARFDLAKLESLNGIYIRAAADERLVELILPRLAAALGGPLDDRARARLQAGMAGLKPRAKTLVELAEAALIYVREPPLEMTEKARRLLDGEARARLARLAEALAALDDWSQAGVEAAVRALADAEQVKLGALAQPLRAALTGRTESPGIFEVMAVLGRDQVRARLAAVSRATGTTG